MSYSEKLCTVSMEAGQDLSSHQFGFVSMSSDGQVDPTGDGAHAVGVLQNDPSAAGRAASVGVSGVTKVIAGGTIAAGAAVASDASGHAVTATSADIILGTALEAADDNDIFAVLFAPRGAQA